jgi:sulfur-oxidizing protein SoxX
MRKTALRKAVVAACLIAVVGMAGSAQAFECKPKTAGYFKELENASSRLPVPIAASGISRPLTDVLGDPQKGRAVMISTDKGNCIACHRVAALSSEPSHGDLGPTLNGVGARYTEAQLRQLVIDPKPFFKNTIMPAYHVKEGLNRVPAAYAGQPILTAAEVEDVVAFLKTLR